MAYSEGGENARLLLRTLRGTTDFSGRSRRTELLYYWIAVGLVSTVVGFIGLATLPVPAAVITIEAIRYIAILPTFALFARRLHDQGRSGWWSFVLISTVLLDVLDTLGVTSSDIGPSREISPLRWTIFALAFVQLILFFLPGTPGANRYGEDPRLAE